MMRAFLTATLVAAPMLAFQNVHAEPLDAATCGLLKGEQARLEQGGVRLSMMKGPDWAKANLGASRLEEIRRLIELDEQVLFRCSGQRLVELPPEADADPAVKAPEARKDGEDTSASKADATTGKDKAPATAAKPAASPKTKETTKKAPAAAKTRPSNTREPPKKSASPPPEKAAAAKPKPKPKADDAYKPPLVNPNVDPFANQPARQ